MNKDRSSETISLEKSVRKSICTLAVLSLLLALASTLAALALAPLFADNTLLPVLGLLAFDALVLFVLADTLLKGDLRSCFNELDTCRYLVASLSKNEGNSLSENTSLSKQLSSLSEHLAESRRQERSIFENAVDVICIIDINSRFLKVSPSALRAWGYSPEELQGKTLTELIQSEDSQACLDAILGAQHSIEKITFENRLKHKEGHAIDLSWLAHWSAKDGGLFCVVRDISLKRLAENKLKESEMQLRTTLESMPVGIARLNEAGYIEFCNYSLESISKRDAEQILATQFLDLLTESDKEKCRTYLTKCKSEEKVPSIEVSLKLPDGALPAEISACTFSTGENKDRLLVTLMDISHRKEAERLRNEFMAMVNHDLRSPLTSIGVIINLLESGKCGSLTEEGSNLCKRAGSEIGRLMQLVNDLLEQERIQSGELILKKELNSAQDIIEAAISSQKAFADRKQITLSTEETELSCHCDRARLIQVLVNLVSNAIKFSNENSTIYIDASKEDADIIFSVKDEGSGIAKDKASLLFERFKQAHADDPAAALRGFGLGLSICKAIVEAHRGQINFKSEEGKGSNFWFSIPS